MIQGKSIIHLPILVCFFCLLGTVTKSHAQEVEFSEEIVEEEDTSFRFKEQYNYFIRADKEEKGLVRFALLRVPNLELPSIGYEHKIRPAFSVFADVGPLWGIVITDSLAGLQINKTSINGADIEVGIRHYYNIVKRIKKGKSANNFSANYVGLNFYSSVRRKSGDIITRQYPSLVFGFQRRLGAFGFLDLSAGLRSELSGKPYVEPLVKFKLGVGL